MKKLVALALAGTIAACAPTGAQVIATCQAVTGTSYGATQFDTCLTQATIADLQREAAAEAATATIGEAAAAILGTALYGGYGPTYVYPYYVQPNVIVWRHSDAGTGNWSHHR